MSFSTESNKVIGPDVPRIDGIAKVTGAALYGADHRVGGVAFAQLVTSTIALGAIRSIDETATRATPGVLDVLTYRNVGNEIKAGKPMLDGGHMAMSVAPLASKKIFFAGQIVAVVIAESLEAAQEGGAALKLEYDALDPSASFFGRNATEVKAKTKGETDITAGNFAKAYETAPVSVDEWYETPSQHHNPLELFQTTCAWDGDDLTIWESSQSVRSYQHGIAEQLGISPKEVRVISPFIGGAFGSRGEVAQSTALIALASKRLGRPVKLVVTRTQGFTLRNFRAETRHHVRLGADQNGRLLAMAHDGWELTSRSDRFALAGIESTTRLYGCGNIEAHVLNVLADRQTPGFMRAPPETPYMFALESAMDELAVKLNIDPVELRKRNETAHEPVKGLPFSSRSLVQCFDAGAEAFGWSKRDPQPGSMRDGDWLVGWGCATSMYPAQIAPATCRITVSIDGRATVETGTHDIGTGMYTIIAQVTSELLGVSMHRVSVVIGDSDLPSAPLTAGSSGAASICNVVAVACEMIRTKLAKAAVKPKRGVLYGKDAESLRLRDEQLIASDGTAEPLLQALHRVGRGEPIVANAVNNPDGSPPILGPMMINKGKAIIIAGSMHKTHVQYAFGAQFVEVRVHRRTGAIHVPRLVGAFAAGRILNRRTAKSQLAGGQVWGLSSALLEATEINPHTARYVNDDLAEYLVPVNPDVREVTTIMIPEEDKLANPLGIKGVGELGIVGVNAAIANAIHHATGVRIRSLPIRIEKILGSAMLA